MGTGCDPRPHRAGIRRQRPATIRCDRLAGQPGRAARRGAPENHVHAAAWGGGKLSAAFSGWVDHAWTVPAGALLAPRQAPRERGRRGRRAGGSPCEPRDLFRRYAPASRSRPVAVRADMFFFFAALPHRLLAAPRPALPAGLDRCHAARTRRAALGFGETCRFTRAGGGVPWRAGSVSLSLWLPDEEEAGSSCRYS